MRCERTLRKLLTWSVHVQVIRVMRSAVLLFLTVRYISGLS